MANKQCDELLQAFNNMDEVDRQMILALALACATPKVRPRLTLIAGGLGRGARDLLGTAGGLNNEFAAFRR